MKLLCVALFLAFCAFPQDEPAAPTPAPGPAREQARSMIVTKYGIVAASQFLASQAGAKMLESGGNAVDAAIAANAVLGVTQPYVNGMGGDLFAIVYEAKTGKVYGLNSSGWTPKALTIDYLKAKNIDKIDSRSVHTITVPGCVAGWDALRKRFGSKPFAPRRDDGFAPRRDGDFVPRRDNTFSPRRDNAMPAGDARAFDGAGKHAFDRKPAGNVGAFAPRKSGDKPGFKPQRPRTGGFSR